MMIPFVIGMIGYDTISINLFIIDTIANVYTEKDAGRTIGKRKRCPERKENTGNIVRLGHLPYHAGKKLLNSSKMSCVFFSCRTY